MGPIFIQSFSFFFISFFLCSDSSIVENLHKKEIQITRKLEFYPHSIYETELDTIPIVNPTPTTGTPIIIPESPPPPLTTTTPPIIVPESPPPPLTTTTPTVPPITTTPASSGGAWCVASQSASDTALQVALDYACGHGGADCSGIQPGASCYIPNSLRDHASYAFNDYYQKNPGPTSCVFGGTAMLTYTDPSSGTCHYPSAKTSTTPTPTTPVITTPTPPIVTTPVITAPSPPAPSIDTPVNPYNNPTTPTIYGEPTESPNSANSLSLNLLRLFTITFVSILAITHI